MADTTASIVRNGNTSTIHTDHGTYQLSFVPAEGMSNQGNPEKITDKARKKMEEGFQAMMNIAGGLTPDGQTQTLGELLSERFKNRSIIIEKNLKAQRTGGFATDYDEGKLWFFSSDLNVVIPMSSNEGGYKDDDGKVHRLTTTEILMHEFFHLIDPIPTIPGDDNAREEPAMAFTNQYRSLFNLPLRTLYELIPLSDSLTINDSSGILDNTAPNMDGLGIVALSLFNPEAGLIDQDPAAAFEVAEQIRIDPIVLDLDGDGIETLSQDAGIHFDLDNNGMAETVGWVGANDGLLVRDINGNGTIDSGAELMGNHTLLENGDKAANGYQALAELDSNGDGIISSDDTAFNELKVWLDKNSDGISQQAELISLADAGIASLNTSYQDSNDDDGHGNITQQTSTATKSDGTVIDTAELFDKHHPWCLPYGRTRCVPPVCLEQTGTALAGLHSR